MYSDEFQLLLQCYLYCVQLYFVESKHRTLVPESDWGIGVKSAFVLLSHHVFVSNVQQLKSEGVKEMTSEPFLQLISLLLQDVFVLLFIFISYI